MKKFTQLTIFLWMAWILGCAQGLFAQQTLYAIEEINDRSYYEVPGADPDLTMLNIVKPVGVENPPVLLWIGQGAWAYVSRKNEMNICREFAKRGICMISPSHRLSPRLLGEEKVYEGVKHPEHVKDIAQAFKWVVEHADEYGYDPSNLFVGGFSSGAHLAALLAMDNRYLSDLGLSNRMIKAIIPVGGGYDIPHYRAELIKEDPTYEQNHINVVFGETKAAHIDASPATYIDSLITPVLLISEGDTYLYNQVFEALLVEKEIPNVQVLNAHSETHGGLWKQLGAAAPNPYRDFMVSYIKTLSAGPSE